jgi:hypothetical protein
MPYDIIGDIHGQADRLEGLLHKLGYRQTAGAWRHPSRTVIFVGDLVDRGPGQRRTLETVRAMVEAGSARMVLGNHEFNAIAWATPDPDLDGEFLRPRLGGKGEKNRRQHGAFLGEIEGDSAEHRWWIDWFMEMPLWIETPDLQVIHACWSPAHQAALRPLLRDGERLSAEAVLRGSRRGEAAYEAIETLLKGPEINLPNGLTFQDKDGHTRDAIRIAWWRADAATLAEAYIGPPGVTIPEAPLPAEGRFPPPARPTFIGHYWFPREARPEPAAPKVACVDYSAGAGGPLVAYRFEGESELTAESFVWF